MTNWKAIARRIPVLPALYREARERWQGRVLAGRPIDDVFGDIYRQNAWGGDQSLSGTGSDDIQTARLVQELPGLWRRLGVQRVLDLPCGDFHWMRKVDLSGVDYTGGDIVPELVECNAAAYAREGVRFMVLNLIQGPLPPADAVFCRDCLVHLSFRDIRAALETISRSEARFLMTTTFTERPGNRDIQTGQWRPLNLQRAPFDFGPPEVLMPEGCTEGGGAYRDKSLAVWPIERIRSGLTRLA